MIEKQCAACEKSFPATTEYFYPAKTNKDGLLRICKSCRSDYMSARYERQHPKDKKPVAPEGMKFCLKCNEAKEVNTKNFGKHPRTKDGLKNVCRVCENKRETDRVNKLNQEQPVIFLEEKQKQCTGPCQNFYPATPEYFHRRRRAKSGLMPECKECQGSRAKIWRKKTIEARIVKSSIYRGNNRERLRAYNRAYGKLHPEQRRAALQRRRAKILQIGGTHTAEQIREQYQRQKGKCYYCRNKVKWGKHHIEHTFPISRVVGTDTPANGIDYIVISCETCNKSKGKKYPWEWPQGGCLLESKSEYICTPRLL